MEIVRNWKDEVSVLDRSQSKAHQSKRWLSDFILSWPKSMQSRITLDTKMKIPVFIKPRMHSHCYNGRNWVQVGNQNSNFWNTSCKSQGTSWLTRLRTMSKDIQKWNQIVSGNSLQQPGCTAKKINEVVSENIQRWSWKKKQKINRHLSIKRIFALHDHLSHAILYNLGEKFCYSSF